jgi:hypothetical protein
MADFEQAVFSAFDDNFPGIACKGCLFHLSQSMLRKVNAEGLKDSYKADMTFKNWIKQCFMLALLPLGEIDQQWTKIVLVVLKNP